MKKIYLMVLSGLFGTVLMAQQANNVVQSDKASRKKETVSQGSVAGTSVTHDGTLQEGLPGFPNYVNSGNKSLDDKNYDLAKSNWVVENPELYDAYNHLASKGVKAEFNLPGYPKYVNTGNPEADYLEYKSALQAWKDANPNGISTEIRRVIKASQN